MVPTDQVAVHHPPTWGLFVAVTASNPCSQLKAMLPELEWQEAATMNLLQYADLARVSAAALKAYSEINTRAWLRYGVLPGSSGGKSERL